jgi:DNA-binding transcriptional ArsR family regulator
VALLRDYWRSAFADEWRRISRRLSLVASAYAWPRVHVNCDEPWPLLLVLPLREADAPPPPLPARLNRRMRALSDEKRVQILRLLARRAYAPQELAPLLRLSPSGLSRHLSALRDAGLVETERDGYWRLQRANLAALDDTLAELVGFVRPPHEGP